MRKGVLILIISLIFVILYITVLFIPDRGARNVSEGFSDSENKESSDSNDQNSSGGILSFFGIGKTSSSGGSGGGGSSSGVTGDVINPSESDSEEQNSTQNDSEIPPDQNGNGEEPEIPQNQKIGIIIENFAYSPLTLTVYRGDIVIWTNLDSEEHTVTSDSGDELNSGPIPHTEIYRHIFTTPGTYDYHCEFYPEMQGRVVVE